MKITLFYISLVLFISSCCDCLDEGEPQENKPFCSPREATVTEFDPTLIQNVLQDQNGNDSIVYTPTDAYSIHGYEFPRSKSSAGNLAVDNGRYSAEAGRDRVAIAQSALPNEVFNQFPVYLAVLTNLPANDDINGDFIVSEVDLSNPVDPVANLRFWGDVDFVDMGFLSESSQDFCDYYENTFQANSVSAVKYGEGLRDNLGSQRSITRSSSNVVSLIDSRGNVLVEDISNPGNRLAGDNYPGLNEAQLWAQIQNALSAAGINNITTTDGYNDMIAQSNEKKIVDIEVHIGDFFYYLARNGRKFLIQIINIDERDVAGIKKRVTFIFTDF